MGRFFLGESFTKVHTLRVCHIFRPKALRIHFVGGIILDLFCPKRSWSVTLKMPWVYSEFRCFLDENDHQKPTTLNILLTKQRIVLVQDSLLPTKGQSWVDMDFQGEHVIGCSGPACSIRWDDCRPTVLQVWDDTGDTNKLVSLQMAKILKLPFNMVHLNEKPTYWYHKNPPNLSKYTIIYQSHWSLCVT